MQLFYHVYKNDMKHCIKLPSTGVLIFSQEQKGLSQQLLDCTPLAYQNEIKREIEDFYYFDAE